MKIWAWSCMTLCFTGCLSCGFIPKWYPILLSSFPNLIGSNKELSIMSIFRCRNRSNAYTVLTIRTLTFKNSTRNISFSMFTDNKVIHWFTYHHLSIFKNICINLNGRSFWMSYFQPLNINISFKRSWLEYYKTRFDLTIVKFHTNLLPIFVER